MPIVRQICVVPLDLVGQGDSVPNKGPSRDMWLATFNAQTFERHDLGVGRLPAQVLDDVEIALDHLDDGPPPTTRFLEGLQD